MAEKPNPTVAEALKKEVLKKIMSNLREQAPAILKPKEYLESVKARFIENVGGTVTLNALRKAGVVSKPKKEKPQEDVLKRNVSSLNEIRKDMRQMRILIERNQQLIFSLQKQTSQSKQAQPAQTFSPSAVQGGMGRVGAIAGQYLAGRGAKQYTSPQGVSIAATPSQQEGGMSAAGIGLGAAAAAGLGFFLRGRYRQKAIATGARMMKSYGVPKFARRMVMQGAGRTALGMGGRAALGMGRLLVNPYTLGITAIASLLLPKDVKTIIRDTVAGTLEGIGINKNLVEIVLAPFDLLSSIAETLKSIVSTIFTSEGRERIVKGTVGTSGVPGSSMESETMPVAPYEPPSVPTEQEVAQKNLYDKSKEGLVALDKDVDEKVKLYQRLEKESIPATASQEDKQQFKQKVGKLVDLQSTIKDQLKKRPTESTEYDLEKKKIDSLTEVAKENIEDLRQTFKKMQGVGGEQVLSSDKQKTSVELQGEPTSKPEGFSYQKFLPTGADAQAEENQQQNLPSQPLEQSETTPAGEQQKLYGDSKQQAPASEQPKIVTEPPTQTPLDRAPKQQAPVEPVAVEPSIGKSLIERSMNVAQQRYTPRQPEVSTNYINNSRSTGPDLDDSEIHYLPSPVASRADLDADIIFSPVA